ncbi:hypothetical protein Salat_2709300 [Sesamum alatum]|uniref:CCHC-type domain-containing protein n=1 Tax=Sesamum alatum TaxID=300844 RepID=A0AAE1XQ61_9LAMI|nr:hypothetical protein Salat_2709300 [Sesamum alatum]
MWEDVNQVEDSISWYDSLRIRINLDVTVPLKRALRFRVPDGLSVVVHLTYERLSNFCYLCGRLGHIQRLCDLRFADGFLDPGIHAPYGPCLRENSLGGRSLSDLSSIRPTMVRPFRSSLSPVVSHSDGVGSRHPVRAVTVPDGLVTWAGAGLLNSDSPEPNEPPSIHVYPRADFLGGPSSSGGPSQYPCGSSLNEINHSPQSVGPSPWLSHANQSISAEGPSQSDAPPYFSPPSSPRCSPVLGGVIPSPKIPNPDPFPLSFSKASLTTPEFGDEALVGVSLGVAHGGESTAGCHPSFSAGRGLRPTASMWPASACWDDY